MKKIFKPFSILLVLTTLSFLFFGCQHPTDNTTDDTNKPVTITVGELTITTLKAYENTVTKDEAAKTITFEPTKEEVEYTLSGSFEGQIINKTKGTVFFLNGVSLSNTEGIPAVYGELKTEIKAAENTVNTITVTGPEKAQDATEDPSSDPAVFCDKAIEIGGSGKLTVSCEYGHGVKASKIELKGSGTFTFDGGSDSSAANCNEFVVEADKTFTANFKDSKNGIKADETITIASGTFNFENIAKVALKTDKAKDDPEKDHFIQLDGGKFTFTSCKKTYETEADKFTKAEAVEGDF